MPEDQGWGRGRRPVINVSWDDAQAYLAWLSRKTGQSYRLLSEAEWEYCCRAGTATPNYAGSEGDLADIAWFNDNSERRTQPVGQKRCNAWGLYDMLGNVWEWCADDLRTYEAAPVVDPVGPPKSARRALRGGSWVNDARDVRAAHRGALDRGIPGRRCRLPVCPSSVVSSGRQSRPARCVQAGGAASPGREERSFVLNGVQGRSPWSLRNRLAGSGA